jgi:hypothetical protein
MKMSGPARVFVLSFLFVGIDGAKAVSADRGAVDARHSGRFQDPAA